MNVGYLKYLLRDNYLKVHIYFEELSTLEMERHPSYTSSNLIGNACYYFVQHDPSQSNLHTL